MRFLSGRCWAPCARPPTEQDKQYLANAVARLAVVKPDVVLVEGSVARMAQEDLLVRAGSGVGRWGVVGRKEA